VVEVYPASADEEGIRLEFFGDEVDAITRFDPLTGHAHESLSVITFYPAKQFVTPADKLNRALRTIREELEQRIVELESQNKLLEAQRLRMRDGVRSGNVAGDGFLQRDRELLASSCPAARPVRSRTRSWIFSRKIFSS
jgi:excinuclease UvrABC helicase subunit UvrB